VTGRLLTRAGFEVRDVDGAQAALELIEGGWSAALVVMDLHLHGMDGPELIERLRALHANLPIVAISGHVEAGDSAGLPPDVEIIQKPFPAETLLEEIRNALARSRPLQA
jgi:two-component system C4-dicarboxylate transport response regulator DctD